MSASNLPISEQGGISTWGELERSFPGLGSLGSSPCLVWDVGPQVASVDQGCRAASSCFVIQPGESHLRGDWSHWWISGSVAARGKVLFSIKCNVSSLELKVNYFSWPTFKVFAVVKSRSFSSVAIRAKVCFHLTLFKQLMGTQHSPEHWEIFMSCSTTSFNNCAAFPKEPGLFWITSPQWGPDPPVVHPWENRNKQRRVPLQPHFQGRRWKSVCWISVNQPWRWAHGVCKQWGLWAPSRQALMWSFSICYFFELKFNVTEQFDPRLTKINPSCNSIKYTGVAPSMTLAHSVFSLKMWIIFNTTSLI